MIPTNKQYCKNNEWSRYMTMKHVFKGWLLEGVMELKETL